MLTIEAVIFDMDGVIFDSEKIYFDAFFVAADLHEIEVDEAFVHSFAGKTSMTCQLMLQSLLDNDAEKTQQFLRDWGNARWAILTERGLDFKDGFLNLFETIKSSGRDIGLVTSASYADMRENFERHNASLLDDFHHIITVDDVRHPKPHPQPYEMMMRQLSRAPERCIVIEDSIPGVTAATAAGANTIMINDHTAVPDHLLQQLTLRVGHHGEIRQFLQHHGL